MEKNDLELLEQEGLKAVPREFFTSYEKEMVSPENEDAVCVLSIYYDGEKWFASATDYFGKDKRWYSGTWYYSAKYLKRLMTTLHKQLNFYGF